MGTRADYIAALNTELGAAGQADNVAAVLDRPVSPVPGVPSIVVTPGNPYLENDGPRRYLIRLDVILFAGRLDTQTAMDTLDTFIPLIRQAAPEAELRWILCETAVENVAGVDYITARCELEGETFDP